MCDFACLAMVMHNGRAGAPPGEDRDGL
jgi:hypothetical protein